MSVFLGIGGGAGSEVEPTGVAELLLAINEFKTVARPLIWTGCSKETLISRLSIVPFEVDPRRTAGGCGPPSCNDWNGIGMIPNACRAGSDATGNCTGMAPLGTYGVEGVLGDAVKVGVELDWLGAPYACVYAY